MGHLGRAAKRLNRSAPALTKCIRRLEKAFGTSLFVRTGRGIRLTAAGEVLMKRARLLHVAVDDATREMDDVSHGIAGAVRVGVVPTMAHIFCRQPAKRFWPRPKTSRFRPSSACHRPGRTVLKDGQIDLAVGVMSTANEFISYSIVEDDVVVVAGDKHQKFRSRRRDTGSTRLSLGVAARFVSG